MEASIPTPSFTIRVLPAATVKITYYDQNGNAVPATAADTITVGPHTIGSFAQGSQPRFSSSLSYHAVITSSGGVPVTALVVEFNNNTRFLAYFEATPNPSNTLYIPTAYNNAINSFNTGYAFSNPNSQPATVTVQYVDAASGTVSNTQTLTIPKFGVGNVYTPASGVITGFVGAAIITSTQPLVAIINAAEVRR